MQKVFKNFYLATLVAGILCYLASIQLFNFKQMLFGPQMGMVPIIQTLTPIVYALFGLLLIIAYKKRWHNPMDLIRATLIGMLILLAIIYVTFNSKLSVSNNVLFFIISTAYIILNLMVPLLPIILWSVINSVSNSSIQLFAYVAIAIGLAMLSNIFIVLINIPALSFLAYGSSNPMQASTNYVFFTAASLILLFLLFVNKWWSISSKPDAGSIDPKGFPWARASYLLLITAGGGVVFLISIALRYFSMGQDESFSPSMIANINVAVTLVLILAVLLLARWRSMYFSVRLCLATLILVSAVVLLLSQIIPFPTYQQSFLRVVFSTLNLALIFPVIQYLYLALPMEDRFSMKLKVELVCLPLLLLVLSQIPLLTDLAFNNLPAIAGVSLVLGLVLLGFSLKASDKLLQVRD